MNHWPTRDEFSRMSPAEVNHYFESVGIRHRVREDDHTDTIRSGVTSIVARIVRLEGGCESGHRAGQWHIHEEPFHAIGRSLAAILRGHR